MSPHPDCKDQTFRELALRVRYFLRKKFSSLDPATIDDLTQEVMHATFLAIKQQRFVARHGARFETFVLQIARHKAADFLRQRRRRREAQAPLDLMAEEAVDVEGDLVQAEILEKIKIAVAALTERHAQILRLHFDQGWKIKEIAQQLDLSEQEVSNLKSYALRRVRESLERGDSRRLPANGTVTDSSPGLLPLTGQRYFHGLQIRATRSPDHRLRGRYFETASAERV